jgi:hypothetical protein
MAALRSTERESYRRHPAPGCADERAIRIGPVYAWQMALRCPGCGGSDLTSEWALSRWRLLAPLLDRVVPRYQCLNDG